jgi:hypothetical protein
MIGILVATATLVVLGVVALGLYTSVPGLLIAEAIAFVAGAGAAALMDVRPARSAVVVAVYLVLVATALLSLAHYNAPPGSQGGPNVLPPG